jgi:Ser/Thr protein kinase RdoA (MazF antagonist)
MKDFEELTNRGRAWRLRRLALNALADYDLLIRQFRLITNDFNGIFRLDSAAGEKYIVRVSLPEERELVEIQSEMAWLAAIRQDTDLAVPEPMPTRSGALVTTATAPGVPEARHVVVFSWLSGPDLAEWLSEANMYKLGLLTARLHDHADQFQPPDGFWLKTYDKTFPFNEELVLFEEGENNPLTPASQAVFWEATSRVDRVIESLNRDPGGLRVIHADLHQWNVKVYQGRLSALDFDDCMWGYPVQDIAISLYYFQDLEAYPAYRQAFEEGYCSLRPWPVDDPETLETLIAGRGLVLANYIITDPNPDYRAMATDYLNRMETRLRRWLDGKTW